MSDLDPLQRISSGLTLVGQRLFDVAKDPRAYPRETMLVALILAVLLLVLVLGVIAIQGVIAELRTRTRLRLRRRPAARALLWMMGAGTIVFVLVLIALVPAVPGFGGGCAACHAVSESVDTWEAGTHAAVGCYRCHGRRGALGAIETSLRGTSALLGATVREPASSRACEECHDELAEGALVSKGIRVRHADVIAAGIGCLSCHERTGHVEATSSLTAVRRGASVPARSVMSRCLACHDGETAAAECETCHVDGKPHDSKEGAVPPGDTPAPVRCDACHSAKVQKRCTACHGLEMPHPTSFRRRHAGLSADDPSLCAKCHEVASANDACACHTEANEHGTYTEWFPVHGRAASSSGLGGCRCHEVSFCAFCHETDPTR